MADRISLNDAARFERTGQETRWGGGTHILRHTGMCRNFWSFFLQKIPIHGFYFSWKIPNFMGPIFIFFFWGGVAANPENVWKFGVFLLQNRKKCVPFFGKIPKHGYLFLEKLPLNMGRGKLGNGEHLSLEAYKYEENNIYVLTIMQHKEEVKFYPETQIYRYSFSR